MEAFGVLDCGETAEWWPASRLLAEIERKSTDFSVIWFYGSPAWVASSGPHEQPLQDLLDGWIRCNREVLNMRPALGDRLRLANIEAFGVTPAPADRATSHHLFRALLGWWAPTYQGMYGVLEAAAWKPLGGGSARPNQLPEPEVLATITGFVQEVRQACQLDEAAHADHLLARLQETQEDLESLLLEREGLSARLAAAQGDQDQEARERKRLERKLAEAKDQIGKLRRAERSARTGEVDAATRVESLEQSLAASAARERELERRLAAEVRAARQLRTRVATSEEAHAQAKRELDILKNECRELQAKNIEAMRQIRDLADKGVPNGAPPPPTASLRHGVVRIFPALRRHKSTLPPERLAALELLRASEWFDEAWYLDTYPDVRDANLDPVEHFLDFGWKEFRNPGPHFDTTYYLANNIDVAKSGMNPLVHFISHGVSEGRRPKQGARNA